jgi:hypothetical protein
MEFDISKYELEETAVLTVQNAKGDDDLLGADGKPVTIELYGGGSRQMVKALHKAGQAAQLRLQQLVRGKIDKQAAEKADQEMVEKLVACTKQISGNFPVSPADLYANVKLGYITKQVVKFLDDDANFAKPSATTS